MNWLFESVANLFSGTGLIAFILGMSAEYIFLKVRCRYLDKIHPEEGRHVVKFKRVYVVWALVFIVIGGLTYKAQTTSDQVVQIIKDTQECSRQFNAALKNSSEIAAEERDVNSRWQDEQFARTSKLNELLLKYGNTGDPGYIEDRVPVDKAYYERVAKIFADRNANAAARRMLGPFPPPSCGK